MKKILGLLVTVAVCSMVACNESGETAVAPSYQNPSQQPQAQNPQVDEAALYQHILDSIAAAQATTLSSSAMVDPYAGQLAVSSSDMMPVLVSSSSDMPLLSSSAPIAPPPSSAVVASSSSAKTTPKSSAAAATTGLELWDGSLGKAHVPVGNDDGGWWYSYTDKDNKGESVIEWEVEPGAKGDLTPVVYACGGVCGTFTLAQGGNENDPFVGFAFGFGASDKVSADISKIGGICVEYSASLPMTVAIGLKASRESAVGWDVPAYELPAGTKKSANLAWSKFEQQWTSPAKLTGEEAAMEASSIKFQIKNKDGESGTFSVTKVGPYGGCN